MHIESKCTDIMEQCCPVPTKSELPHALETISRGFQGWQENCHITAHFTKAWARGALQTNEPGRKYVKYTKRGYQEKEK